MEAIVQETNEDYAFAVFVVLVAVGGWAAAAAEAFVAGCEFAAVVKLTSLREVDGQETSHPLSNPLLRRPCKDEIREQGSKRSQEPRYSWILQEQELERKNCRLRDRERRGRVLPGGASP